MTQNIQIPNLKGKKVLIATPAYDGKVGLGFLNSLIPTLMAARAGGAEVSYAIYANSGSIPRVRNQAVASMMGQGFTDLFFIDADMGWDAQDFCRMLSFDTEIVAATYPARSEDNPRWIIVWPDEVRQHKSGLLTARRAGTGFMRINRKAFEVLEEKHPDLHYYAPHTTDDSEIPHLFAFFDYFLHVGKDGRRGHLSEDYHFCDLARDAGLTIWVDPNVNMRHYGFKTFEGKFSDVVKVQEVTPGGELEAK